MITLSIKARIIAHFASANIPNELANEVVQAIEEYTGEAEMSNGWALNLAKDFVNLYEDDTGTAMQEFKGYLID